MRIGDARALRRFGPGVLVALVLLAGACVQASECPSGAFCASDKRCIIVDATELCVSTDALDDCAGRQPGDACGAGRCYEGTPGPVCLTAACGDEFVEHYDEVCDDGNNISGDGCAGDCRSDETCGNGVTDLVSAEACDDGNLRSHDGCASTCVVEAPVWQQESFSITFARTGFAVVFDSKRGHAIAYGGRGSEQSYPFDLGDIRAWSQRRVVDQTPMVGSGISPTSRAFHAMAFDDVRGVVVMFGGAGMLADTWEWNGRTWRFREVFGPPPRSRHVMVYDRARHRTVMFGGIEDQAAAGDVWEFDGDRWEGRTIAGAPPGSSARAAAYDPARGHTVVITTQGTWTFDGTVWAMASTDRPAATGLSAAFDTKRQQVIALGVAPGGVAHLWAFDGSAWVDLGGNSDIGSAVLTYDPMQGRAIAWGAGALGTPLPIHEWDGAAWTSYQDLLEFPPSGFRGAASAREDLRHRLVVFGGSGAATYSDDTWLYDGVRWMIAAPSTSPSGRAGHAMAYDEERGEIVLFGGRDSTVTLADTWVWANNTWTLRTPSRSPPARRGHVMAYDPVRRRVVLFSGSSSVSGNTPTADTWEWDGATWTSVSTPGPAGSTDMTLAFDRTAGTLVYFDGAAAGRESWTYDGAWHLLVEPVTPRNRQETALGWDGSRRRLAIYGGKSLSTTTISPTLGDVWERNATMSSPWRQLTTAYVGRRGHLSMTNPTGAGIVVVYGDSDGFAPTPLPAILRWRSSAPEETCLVRIDGDGDGLVGCDDPDCEDLCAPRCAGDPGCTLGPRCGDGACDLLETSAICAADCGAPPVICGDAVCDAGETCFGDCAIP